jgi:hypothetical protein
MTRYSGLKVFLITALLSASDAYALIQSKCTVNGEPVECPEWFLNSGWIIFPFFLLFFLFSAVALVFWVWMLIDCLKSSRSDKVVWVIVLLFGNFLGALLYFFLARNKDEQAQRPV